MGDPDWIGEAAGRWEEKETQTLSHLAREALAQPGQAVFPGTLPAPEQGLLLIVRPIELLLVRNCTTV